MKEAKISCPKCGGHLVFPIELAGQEALCPHCNESILLAKTKSITAWVFAVIFIFAIVCVASILIWKYPSKNDLTTQVRIAENTNSQPIVLQKDPLATGQLMSAIQYGGNAETVKLLLEKGADVNARDNEGWHPLQLAAKRGDVEIVKLLLGNGADVNATNNYGVTALESAAYRGYLNVVKLLLEKGADVNAKDVDKTAALTGAAKAGQTNVVGLLLDKGADINATNWSGDSVLMTAVEEGKIEVVRLLLARGANVNAEDMMGHSALDEAKKNANAAIVQLLQQGGATKSSATKQDEAMSNNLKDMSNSLQKLQESAAALSNSWQDLQQAGPNAAIASDKPAFEVLKVTAKPTEQNNMWWRYGYRLTVRNNGLDDSRQFFEIQFLDVDGYVIDTKTDEAVIKPGATEIITGETLVNLPGAARVAKLKAIWKP
jgi:ankyrin repeat protein